MTIIIYYMITVVQIDVCWLNLTVKSCMANQHFSVKEIYFHMTFSSQLLPANLWESHSAA